MFTWGKLAKHSANLFIIGIFMMAIGFILPNVIIFIFGSIITAFSQQFKDTQTESNLKIELTRQDAYHDQGTVFNVGLLFSNKGDKLTAIKKIIFKDKNDHEHYFRDLPVTVPGGDTQGYFGRIGFDSDLQM